jgi:hypothetical protein
MRYTLERIAAISQVPRADRLREARRECSVEDERESVRVSKDARADGAALSEAERDAVRRAFGQHVEGEPERDARGVERYLVEVESALRIYRLPASPAPALETESRALPDQRERESVASELSSLADVARSLAHALEGLGAHARDRLDETTRFDAEAMAGLRKLCQLAESQASVAAGETARDPEPHEPAPVDPAFLLVERLAVVWTEHTCEQLLRDRDARSSWSQFVETACALAGIEPEHAHRLRLRAFDSAGLGESVGLLDSLPEL